MPKAMDFKEGDRISADSSDFQAALRAAVDYRGDTTFILRNGEPIEGFLFTLNGECAELFPVDSEEKRQVLLSEIEEIVFSGADEALGKSWEDWVKRRETEKHQRA